MVLVLLNNREMPIRSVQPFAASRELGNADEHAALVKVGALLPKTDSDGRLPLDPITIPVRDRVLWRPSWSVPVTPSEILGLS